MLVDAHDVSGDAQLSDGLFGAWRDGGQAQYTEHVSPADAGHPLQPTIAWMEENAGASLDLQAIALHASVSVRTLNRQFREHFGTTPLGLLARIRVDRARRLLESTGLTVDRIAEQSGFGSYPSLRFHFLRTSFARLGCHHRNTGSPIPLDDDCRPATRRTVPAPLGR